MFYTTQSFDGLGRSVSTALPDGSQSELEYVDSQMMHIEQAGNNRALTRDAAERLTQVQENAASFGGQSAGNTAFPTYTTRYLYDALDNLKTGRFLGLSIGNTVARGFSYNSRLQVKSLWDTVNYNPSSYLFVEFLNWGTPNNGNVPSVTLQAVV